MAHYLQPTEEFHAAIRTLASADSEYAYRQLHRLNEQLDEHFRASGRNVELDLKKTALAEDFLGRACTHFGVELGVVVSPSKCQPAVNVRAAVAQLCHVLLRWSQPQIGQFLQRDRSTVSHCLSRHVEWATYDAKYREAYGRLYAECTPIAHKALNLPYEH